MKKLFLTSNGLSALPEFLDIPSNEAKMAYITTTSNTYENPTWLDQIQNKIRSY